MLFSVKFKTFLALLVVVFSVGTAVFLVWANTPLGPMPEGEFALRSDDQVTVALDPWITFEPAVTDVTAVETGLILYARGGVAARSCEATITREQQQEAFTQATVALLDSAALEQ